MAKLSPDNSAGLREFLLQGVDSGNLPAQKRSIARRAMEQFNVSRQTINRHLKGLEKEGLIEAKGSTSARDYKLKILDSFIFTFAPDPAKVEGELDEDTVWRAIQDKLRDLPENVTTICQYGITEMVNNVFSHSGSQSAKLMFIRDAIGVSFWVEDDGIGVFEKIQHDFHLTDPRHALLELCKGKLTSDAANHSGEGIFFTSRMFDKFAINSGSLAFCRFNKKDDWLIEVDEQTAHGKGTSVFMRIALDAKQTMPEIFAKFASEHDDYGFTRTQIPLTLAIYEGEKLISRSQAKRLTARFEKFKEVWLDFKDVETIGQAFADELFRIFVREHPQTQLHWVNTAPEVLKMIDWVRSEKAEQQRQLFPG